MGEPAPFSVLNVRGALLMPLALPAKASSPPTPFAISKLSIQLARISGTLRDILSVLKGLFRLFERLAVWVAGKIRVRFYYWRWLRPRSPMHCCRIEPGLMLLSCEADAIVDESQ